MILQNLFLLVSLDPFLFLGWIHVLTQTSRMWRQPEEPKIQRVKLLTFISLVLEFLWYKYIFEKLARLISNITSINFGWNCSILVLCFFHWILTSKQMVSGSLFSFWLKIQNKIQWKWNGYWTIPSKIDRSDASKWDKEAKASI